VGALTLRPAFSHRMGEGEAGSRYHSMRTLKTICLTIVHLVKQAWFLPRTLAEANKDRRRQIVLDELEAERLDRIRNPSKYLGR